MRAFSCPSVDVELSLEISSKGNTHHKGVETSATFHLAEVETYIRVLRAEILQACTEVESGGQIFFVFIRVSLHQSQTDGGDHAHSIFGKRIALKVERQIAWVVFPFVPEGGTRKFQTEIFVEGVS